VGGGKTALGGEGASTRLVDRKTGFPLRPSSLFLEGNKEEGGHKNGWVRSGLR